MYLHAAGIDASAGLSGAPSFGAATSPPLTASWLAITHPCPCVRREIHARTAEQVQLEYPSKRYKPYCAGALRLWPVSQEFLAVLFLVRKCDVQGLQYLSHQPAGIPL